MFARTHIFSQLTASAIAANAVESAALPQRERAYCGGCRAVRLSPALDVLVYWHTETACLRCPATQ